MEKQSAGKNKKKIMIIIICVAASLLIAAICFFAVRKYINDHILDGGNMVNNAAFNSVEYYLSPDEYGRSSSIYLKDSVIKYYSTEGNGEDSVQKSCSAENELCDAIEDIIREYDVYSWQNLPASDIEILDASTATMKIEFADGTTVCLGDDYQMPDGAWKAVSEIVDLLESYVDEHGE